MTRSLSPPSESEESSVGDADLSNVLGLWLLRSPAVLCGVRKA